MKKVLFDVNVILDVLLDRKPFANAGAAAWAAVETGAAKGYLSAHAITTIHYLIAKDTGSAKALAAISAILSVFSVARVDAKVLRESLELPCTDFEDAVTAAAARNAGCDYIVTRDPKRFRGSPVRPLTPEVAVRLLRNE